MKPITHILTALLLSFTAHAATAVEPVILTEQGVKNLGLETIVVEETDFVKSTFALGRADVIPEKRSVLSSRIFGRVIENNLRIGTFVEKGQNLIRLESRQPGNPPPTVWLTAPASGTIISVNTALGSPVEPSDSLAEIADLSTIHLIATLPQATAGKIGEGTTAEVHFPLLPDMKATAKFLKFDAYGEGQGITGRPERTDADLNNAGVIFTIKNPENQILPGMNAECSIIMEKREGVMSVPRAAIQGNPSSRHVYVKHMTIPNAFDRVNVQTGMIGNDLVEILDGLFPGDEVVTRGSYSLGFAGGGGGLSLKEALDAAHGHEHNDDGSEKSPDPKTGADAGDPEHAHQGISKREIILMITSGILALLLLAVSLRRKQPIDENAELS
jgi:multidrug efflux pump subunit AcrA (membrane-fusion protein)